MGSVYRSGQWKGRGGSQIDTTLSRWARKWRHQASALLAAALDRRHVARDRRDVGAASIVRQEASPPTPTKPEDWPCSVVGIDWFQKSPAPSGQIESVQFLRAIADARNAMDALKMAGGISDIMKLSRMAFDAHRELGFAIVRRQH
jgi:hypothetical protein